MLFQHGTVASFWHSSRRTRRSLSGPPLVATGRRSWPSRMSRHTHPTHCASHSGAPGDGSGDFPFALVPVWHGLPLPAALLSLGLSLRKRSPQSTEDSWWLRRLGLVNLRSHVETLPSCFSSVFPPPPCHPKRGIQYHNNQPDLGVVRSPFTSDAGKIPTAPRPSGHISHGRRLVNPFDG
jgi:hypothetical protein